VFAAQVDDEALLLLMTQAPHAALELYRRKRPRPG
jgi:hypothetical protein